MGVVGPSLRHLRRMGVVSKVNQTHKKQKVTVSVEVKQEVLK